MFKFGDRVLLEHNLNAIPAGCYRCVGIDEYFITLAVGTRIQFSITLNGLPLLRKVYPPAAFTHPNEFVPKYYELLRQIKGQTNDPSLPFTLCMLDPSIPIVQKYEESSPFETRQ